ncbi:hypothetical protein CDL12_23272 [Handroanthus impetiginosus]|uniref:Uncharacterized protein n=1 Tax=Handroanthus impetiginosus TaxID=429701 RepID=A0A2G9GFX9_9LAMI|nr:hypothetical protein CDL12_23272 [Handroanthus impetiginosus]
MLFSLTSLVLIFTSHSLLCQASADINSRQILEIAIGGGAYPPYSPPDYSASLEPESPPPHQPPSSPPLPPLPPPPPQPSPQPPALPSFQVSGSLPPQLQKAVKVIQRFKTTIKYDPFGITKTWRGRICFDKTKYKGFICDTTISDNKIIVAAVNFNGFNFDGEPSKPLGLKNFIDGLSDSIVFHVNSNNFTGEVPLGITNVPSLFELDLSNNDLKGEFPEAVLKATNLTFLDLRFNKLTGCLPPKVFTLDLDVLYLNYNQFVGHIPKNLGNTPSLYLTLANNKFTGPIPKSIGQASNTLREILLLNNKLSGCLPYQIGKLEKVTVFNATKNQLTGPIPLSFGCLKSMNYLDLSRNKMYGTVPESLCKLRSLLELKLKFNYFTHVGPECRKLIANKKLDIKMNCILGLPFQRSPQECKAFFLKQSSCPKPSELNIVPCKIDASASTEESEPMEMASPHSYAALHKHRPSGYAKEP